MSFQPDFSDKSILEKYSSAFSLSDMEMAGKDKTLPLPSFLTIFKSTSFLIPEAPGSDGDQSDIRGLGITACWLSVM